MTAATIPTEETGLMTYDTHEREGGTSAVCIGCGEHFDRSALTDSYLNGYGHRGALVHGGDDHMHLHGVTIAALDALTVRGSLKRWAHHARIRGRWHLRRAVTCIEPYRVRLARRSRP